MKRIIKVVDVVLGAYLDFVDFILTPQEKENEIVVVRRLGKR